MLVSPSYATANEKEDQIKKIDDKTIDNVMMSLLKKQKSENIPQVENEGQKKNTKVSGTKKTGKDIDAMIKLLLYLEKTGKMDTNPVLFTWWGNIAKCFLNCWRWRKGMMKQPIGCTCD